MHGRWTYSPNEEAREVGGELYFFFFFWRALRRTFGYFSEPSEECVGGRGRYAAWPRPLSPNSIQWASVCKLAPAARNSVAAKLLQITALC